MLSACSRDDDGVKLVAPFSEEGTVVGHVTAVWNNSGEERGFAGGDRLKEPEVRFQYRAEVHNRLSDKLFVRLSGFELVDEHALGLGGDTATVECTLGPGAKQAVLAGDVWVPKHAAGRVKDFRLTHFSVPLSERGRALYREFLLQGRTGNVAEVDAEIGRYAAAPPCTAR